MKQEYNTIASCANGEQPEWGCFKEINISVTIKFVELSGILPMLFMRLMK